MKYYKTIISLFFLNIFGVLFLLYFSNITRGIEKENYALNEKINFIREQININEIEYNIYNNYEYLQKMQRVYFDQTNDENFNKRISFAQLKNQNIENFYTVGIK